MGGTNARILFSHDTDTSETQALRTGRQRRENVKEDGSGVALACRDTREKRTRVLNVVNSVNVIALCLH